MARRDLWDGCYEGDHRAMKPEDFRRMFCHLCRNPECSHSATGRSRWVNRMETQVDRLLDNPLFANPDDPKFAELRKMAFEDAARQAIALDISAKRGDWEIPSPVEVQQGAPARRLPAGFQAPPKSDPESKVETLWEGDAEGSRGQVYKVTLTRRGDEDPVWTCTCPAFQYRKAPPQGCKHILDARAQYEQEEVEVVEEKPQVPTAAPASLEPPPKLNPLAWKQMQDRGLVPRQPNTRFPAEGMMIDGTPAPPPEVKAEAADPWAPPAPPPSESVVPIHGKVVMGKKP